MSIFARIVHEAAKVGNAAAEGLARRPMEAAPKGKKGGPRGPRKSRCQPCEAMKRKAKARKWTGL